MTYLVTEAGKQIERLLEEGYADAAELLYIEAIQHDVELVGGDDSAAWHRDVQERTGWRAEVASLEQFADALAAAGEDPDDAYEQGADGQPMPRDAAGRVKGEGR